nr:MAG TPA: hypothetical protein [Caudoviricetes sp.]
MSRGKCESFVKFYPGKISQNFHIFPLTFHCNEVDKKAEVFTVRLHLL